MSYFFRKSCEAGPNVLDWIRSIYFSLLGSSTLTLALKWYSLSWLALVSYAVAIILFFIGLYYSVVITKRFKQLEKDYDKDAIIDKNKVPLHPDYYKLKDEKYKNQHFLLFTLWLLAILVIGYSGYFIESKSAQSITETNAVISNTNTKVQQLEEESQKTISSDTEKKRLQDLLDATLVEVDRQKKEIEVLKKSKKP
jgi:Ca2+/Na+ antiporter